MEKREKDIIKLFLKSWEGSLSQDEKEDWETLVGHPVAGRRLCSGFGSGVYRNYGDDARADGGNGTDGDSPGRSFLFEWRVYTHQTGVQG